MTTEELCCDAEAAESVSASPVKQINWLLLLLAPIGAGIAVVTSCFDPKGFQQLQVTLEYAAPFLVGLVAVIYAVRALITRSRLCILLAALAAAFTIRENQDLPYMSWAHEGIYVMVAIIGVWAAVWAKSLAKPLRDWQHTSWVVATFWAYLVAMLIGRRAFKGIPGEHEIHRSLEESAETVAHMMFLATSLVGSWRRPAWSRPSSVPSSAGCASCGMTRGPRACSRETSCRWA